ncbi:hypothetical protein ACFS5M_04420 [Lacinutrix iliipiscaria]|uniref:Uncharacterized protein n=1 Tax=Lacinutrix iliipiscaria TaxID=1230532 RepID=A0ABW5WKZ2_9FLAO
MINIYYYIIFLGVLLSCQSGNLEVIGDISPSLTEVSAIETVSNLDLLWVVEDAGNQPIIYGLNTNGSIETSIQISNSKNKDWEDLTTDSTGNLYVGDFGNNNKKRKYFKIYKVENLDTTNNKTTAKTINFKLPVTVKSLNFESFFLWKNAFYIFSKDAKTCQLFKVPNRIGNHVAEFISKHEFKGENNKVTSADISEDGKTVVLLNHDKLWKLSQFESDDFFSGKIQSHNFNHNSQKEGVCFKNENEVLITDESNKNSNIYLYDLN